MVESTTAPRVRRGSYAKSAEVQDRILEAATEKFAYGGYHAVTLKQIAAAAGVGERGLVYHFSTKEELLIAVLDRHEQRGGESVLAPCGAAGLGSILRIVAEDASRPGLVELHCLLSAETIAPDHPAHERYRKRYSGLRGYLSLNFEELARRRQLVTGMAPAALASGLIALMDGLQLQWAHDKSTDLLGTIEGYLAGVLSQEAMNEVRSYIQEAAAVKPKQQTAQA